MRSRLESSARTRSRQGRRLDVVLVLGTGETSMYVYVAFVVALSHRPVTPVLSFNLSPHMARRFSLPDPRTRGPIKLNINCPNVPGWEQGVLQLTITRASTDHPKQVSSPRLTGRSRVCAWEGIFVVGVWAVCFSVVLVCHGFVDDVAPSRRIW